MRSRRKYSWGMERTNAANTPTRDGDTFGPFSRYQLHFHESKRQGVESQWFVLDAEAVDGMTITADGVSAPAVIRQAATIQEAIEGLPLGWS